MNRETTQPESGDRIARLISLKRYEAPSPHFETRTLASLREKLAHTPPGFSWSYWFSEWKPVAVRYVFWPATAAVCIAAVTVWWARRPDSTFRETPSIAAKPQAAAPLDAQPSVMEAAESIGQVYSKPVFVFEHASNRAPARTMRIGPSSQPVRYDF
ncbi:MAG: hypothetical protein NZ740_07390 [Kiritimatiellae bacterium]|nr:hypothetical protein [Kiritimatiellia bacterium]MDW8458922.1 hypothetical protein [Verrucomicrobiota bacterium]